MRADRKEGRVNINYRFPGVGIESNLATVRNTKRIDRQFRCHSIYSNDGFDRETVPQAYCFGSRKVTSQDRYAI